MGMFDEIADKIFEVELSGQVVKVVFTMNALEALESKGLDLDELQGKGLPIYERCLTMLWAGTRDFHEDLSRDDLGRLMEPWQLSDVMKIVDQAVVKAFTPKKKVGKEPVAVSPTGS